MANNESPISPGKMRAVFLLAGPPPAALVFWWLVTFGSRNADTVFTKINEAILLTFSPYGLLATYAIWVLPSLLTYWGCSMALQIARTARQRILAGACIGAFIHFGTGALVMVVALSGGRPEQIIWLFTAFAGAAGGVSGALCALIVNIYLTSPTEV